MLLVQYESLNSFVRDKYITDKSTSTEGIRTTDPQYECPSTLHTEVIGKFPVATASRSTLYQHCYTKVHYLILLNDLLLLLHCESEVQ